MTTPTIAFIGAGNMNGAIIQGLLTKHYPSDHIRISNRSASKLAHYDCLTSTDNCVAAHGANVVVLGVKPQHIKTVCSEISDLCQTQNSLIISIAAGITLDQIQSYLGYPAAITRAMPNTPVSVGLGATALCANNYVNEEQKSLSSMLFDNTGISAWLEDETLMDPLVSLSGSGPAYIFLMMQAMSTAAIKMGLPAELSRDFCIQTVLGAATLAAQTDADFSKLRENVTSPGGTTAAAIEIFKQHHFNAIVDEAMISNTKRSKEITEENS